MVVIRNLYAALKLNWLLKKESGKKVCYELHWHYNQPLLTFTMTIFAFLTLNTMSPAHMEIFGAKFSSYERLRLCRLYTVGYAVGGWRT